MNPWQGRCEWRPGGWRLRARQEEQGQGPPRQLRGQTAMQGMIRLVDVQPGLHSGHSGRRGLGRRDSWESGRDARERLEIGPWREQQRAAMIQDGWWRAGQRQAGRTRARTRDDCQRQAGWRQQWHYQTRASSLRKQGERVGCRQEGGRRAGGRWFS